VNQNVASPPAVTITDAIGNPVPSVSVTFSPASGGGSVTGGAASTNASGVATIGGWKLGTTAGANTLDAASAGLTTVTFSATGTPDVPANISKTSTDPQNGTVGAAVGSPPAVHVTDQFGNATPGITVNFAITGGGGGLTGPAPVTNASGNAVVGSWTPGSTLPGPNQMSAAAVGGSNPSTSFTVYVPPVIGGDSSQVMGNTTASSPVTPDVDANDIGLNGEAIAISTTGALATVRGGTLTLAANGTFSYLPPAGNVLRDSVQYTIGDSHLSSSGFIKLRFVGRVWYVENSFGGAATGRDVSPFTSVAAAEAVAVANDSILVRTGSGVTAGGTLKNGQLLRGQGHSAAFTTTLNGQAVTLLPTGTAPRVGNLVLGSNNTLRGLRVETTSGKALDGPTIGNLSMTEGSIGATNGPAFDLALGTIAMTLDSLRSTNSTLSGISISSVTGNVTINGGTASSITGVNTNAVSISNSPAQSLNFSFPGAISKTSAGNNGIQIGGGGTIQFTGPSIVLNTGNGIGISILNSTGTISFADSVKITTTSGTGLSYTGGGTLTLAGPNNSISSSSGSALSVVGTAGDHVAGTLAFRSVSSGGGTKGVSVQYFDGPLTIAGSGTAGSGGTIQNTSGRGVDLQSVSGAIALSRMNFVNAGTTNGAAATTCGEPVAGDNTLCTAAIHVVQAPGGVTLTGILVDGGAQIGINTNAVSNLVMSNVEVRNVGNEAEEHGVLLVNTTGTGSITGSNFHNNSSKQLYMHNGSGTLSAFPIKSTTLANSFSPNGSQGLLVEAYNAGTVMNVSAGGSGAGEGVKFSNLYSNGFQSASSNSATLNFNVTNSTVSNTNGTVVQASLSSTTNSTLQGNVITAGSNTTAGVISLKSDGQGSMNVSVIGNTIGTNGVADSGTGCDGCNGLFINPRFGGNNTINVIGNTIQNVDGSAIVFGQGENFGGVHPNAHLKITGNLIRQPGSFASANRIAIQVTNGVTSGPPADAGCLRAEIGGTVNPGTWPSQTADAMNRIEGDWNTAASGGEIFLWQRFSTVFRVPSYAAPTNTFMNARNVITSSTPTASSLGTITASSASCF
jgi:hypothetical protein